MVQFSWVVLWAIGKRPVKREACAGGVQELVEYALRYRVELSAIRVKFGVVFL